MSVMYDMMPTELEEAARRPIDEYVGDIQTRIDGLRRDGTNRVVEIRSHMQQVREDRSYGKEERKQLLAADRELLKEALRVESQNKAEVGALVREAETYIKEHYDSEVFKPLEKACAQARKVAEANLKKELKDLKDEHAKEEATLREAGGPDVKQELKDAGYVYRNRVFEARMAYERELQEIKDRRHEAFVHQYHLIDLLRMSNFTLAQSRAQRAEQRRYYFNRKTFLLNNGLYIVIVLVFLALAIATPAIKQTQLVTFNNVMNILQQASPRMFLALGVAGLILLTGTDLSVGRMVGMGMVAATTIMHQGPNTGTIFGVLLDFTGMPLIVRVIIALVVNVCLCTAFTSIAGFFTARFKMHPFVATMSNMLIIFGLVTYATKGVSFGAIDSRIPRMVIPRINGFPTIILWAVAAIAVVWFIWNKTPFGKHLYAVGGNPEAAAVSGINVFGVTLAAFVMAGVLYGFGSWLECLRMTGSGSAAYGQGWDMDAIAACVVGGVSFTGGIGKISGVCVGVMIFTALTYALTILGIDTNLQFVFEGIIIIAAVTLDCLKYVQKK